MDCKLFHIMLYIIILTVRKFRQPSANRFSTARQKPAVGGTMPPSLNKAKTKIQIGIVSAQNS